MLLKKCLSPLRAGSPDLQHPPAAAPGQHCLTHGAALGQLGIYIRVWRRPAFALHVTAAKCVPGEVIERAVMAYEQDLVLSHPL